MFWNIILSKLILATLVFLGAEALRRRGVRPQVGYAAWAAVLVILLVPPVLALPLIQKAQAALPMVAMTSNPTSCGQANTCGLSDSGAMTAPPETSVPMDEGSSGGLQEAPQDIFTVQQLLLGLWAAGTIGILGYRLFRRQRLGQLVQVAAPVTETLSQRCQELARQLGVRTCPNVVMANGRFSPFLWHPMRGQACIVFPQELLDLLSEDSIEAILRHELIHVRRRDTLRHHVEAVVFAVWWWFPIIWLARKRLRECEELCTDTEVIQSAPGAKRAYATALLDAYEFLLTPNARTINAAPAFAKRHFLKDRIELVAGNQLATLNRRTSAVMASVLGIGLVSLGFLTIGEAQGPAKPDTPTDKMKRVAATAATSQEVVRREEHAMAAPRNGQLIFKSFTGSILVKTHKANTVTIASDLRTSEQWADQLDEVRFDYQSSNGNVEMVVGWHQEPSNGHKIGASHILTIPEDYGLDLTTAGGSIAINHDIRSAARLRTSGGSIALQDVDGPAAIHTSGGSIKVGNVQGDANITTSGGSIAIGHVSGHPHMTTSGGSIYAELGSQLEKPGSIRTSGGNIHLVVPADFQAHVRAKTSGGKVNTDFTTAKRKHRHLLDTEVNGGGPLIELQTSGGNITLSKS